MLLIFLLSAQPKLPEVPGLDTFLFRMSWEDWSDKIKHFAAYAVLASLVWRALGSGISRWRRLWLAIGISAAYGATDEFHQRFSNRSCDFCDWTADVLGASLAAVVAYIGGGERWQRNAKKPTKRKHTK